MGSALYISIEKEIPDFVPFVSGKAISEAEKHLSKISRKLGMKPLMDFFSPSPEDISGFLEDENINGDDLVLPDIQWFDASEGLKTVMGLLSYLRGNPNEVSGEVVKDLIKFERVLSVAHEHTVRWHLSVDF